MTEHAKRQGMGTALLLLAETEPYKAYVLLKQLGLCIADLQAVGFTETDIAPLQTGWRMMQQRIEEQGGHPPEEVD